MNEGTTCREWGNLDRAAQDLGAFAHGDESDASLAFGGTKPFAVIFNFQNQRGRLEAETKPRFFCAGMPRDIVKRFLKHSIYLDAGGCSHGIGVS